MPSVHLCRLLQRLRQLSKLPLRLWLNPETRPIPHFQSTGTVLTNWKHCLAFTITTGLSKPKPFRQGISTLADDSYAHIFGWHYLRFSGKNFNRQTSLISLLFGLPEHSCNSHHESISDYYMGAWLPLCGISARARYPYGRHNHPPETITNEQLPTCLVSERNGK